MGKLIVENEINGYDVYGVRQMQYTVDGVSGQDYTAALTAAAFKQSVAIEASAGSFADVVRLRQRKVDALGEALAVLAKAIATLATKNQEPGDKSAADGDLTTAAATVAGYGITMTVTDDSKITRENALKAQSDIQYALDVEDNNLQQDTVSLQSLLTKRDNSFSNAAKLVKKSLNASDAAIKNIN